MESNFRLLWKGLVNAYDAGWDLVLVNLLWVILSLPIITLPFTMAGLAFYTRELAHGDSVNWKDFFRGIKEYFWPSMRYLLLNLTIFFLISFYYLYVGSFEGNLKLVFTVLIYSIVVVWLLYMPFIFPLMLEQKKPSLRTALRNGLVLILKWPGIALLVEILVYILIVASSYFIIPWFFLTASLCSFLLSYVVMIKVEESNKIEAAKETPNA
jgi:uncharacterized membrane protein YesL